MSSGNEETFARAAERIAEERVRLGFEGQGDAAKACGVSRKTWGEYERAQTIPRADVMMRFAAIGADVGYILTGVRAPPKVADGSGEYLVTDRRKQSLLDNYDGMDEEGKRAIELMALRCAEAQYTDEMKAKRRGNGR